MFWNCLPPYWITPTDKILLAKIKKNLYGNFYFLPYFISCTSSFEDKKKFPPSLPLGSRNLQHFFKDGLNKILVYLLLTLWWVKSKCDFWSWKEPWSKADERLRILFIMYRAEAGRQIKFTTACSSDYLTTRLLHLFYKERNSYFYGKKYTASSIWLRVL